MRQEGARMVSPRSHDNIVLRWRQNDVKGCEAPIKYLKRYPIELVDDEDLDAEDVEMETGKGTDEAAALEDEAFFVCLCVFFFVQNKADIPLYNTHELKSHGNYIDERIPTAQYHQGWSFLTQWVGYLVSDPTWEPMKAFFHADTKLNQLFVEFSFVGAPKYDTAMQAAKKLSQKCKKKEGS